MASMPLLLQGFGIGDEAGQMLGRAGGREGARQAENHDLLAFEEIGRGNGLRTLGAIVAIVTAGILSPTLIILFSMRVDGAGLISRATLRDVGREDATDKGPGQASPFAIKRLCFGAWGIQD